MRRDDLHEAAQPLYDLVRRYSNYVSAHHPPPKWVAEAAEVLDTFHDAPIPEPPLVTREQIDAYLAANGWELWRNSRYYVTHPAIEPGTRIPWHEALGDQFGLDALANQFARDEREARS